MSVFDGFKPYNQSRTIKTAANLQDRSILLSQYLAERFTYRSHENWLDEIRNKRFILNGRRVESDTILSGKIELIYEFQEREEPECDLDYQLLGMDENFICAAKSGNLPTHPAGRYYKNTLWYLLQKDFGPCAPVNRLDRETSGVILFARNPESARFFSRNPMRKIYHVIVHGDFPQTLDAAGFLLNDFQSAIRKKRKFVFEKPSDIACEDCRTIFRKLDYRDGLSLVEAELKSGRTHQIRATCCSLGFPVAGDKIYGVDENIFLRFIENGVSENDLQKLIFPHQALHAYSLTFTAPDSSEELTFSAEMPLFWQS
ncbi:MAG: RluA family pseudouridine synthase [Lentisphaeria bacterium]|nr:RluA family pseudouridine synthase [Lentisphaeria bacterium]